MSDNSNLTALASGTGPSSATPIEPVPVSPVPASVPSAYVIDEIASHLGAAVMQMLPSDDRIICEHVRTAHALALALRRAV